VAVVVVVVGLGMEWDEDGMDLFSVLVLVEVSSEGALSGWV